MSSCRSLGYWGKGCCRLNLAQSAVILPLLLPSLRTTGPFLCKKGRASLLAMLLVTEPWSLYLFTQATDRRHPLLSHGADRSEIAGSWAGSGFGYCPYESIHSPLGHTADDQCSVRAQHFAGIACWPTCLLNHKHMRGTHLSLCDGGQADGPCPAICCNSVGASGAGRACIAGHRVRRWSLLSGKLVWLCCSFPPSLPHLHSHTKFVCCQKEPLSAGDGAARGSHPAYSPVV